MFGGRSAQYGRAAAGDAAVVEAPADPASRRRRHCAWYSGCERLSRFALQSRPPGSADGLHGAALGRRNGNPTYRTAGTGGIARKRADRTGRAGDPEKYHPKGKDEQLHELLALHGGAPEGSQGDGQPANPPPSSPAPGQDAQSSRLDAPPPGYVPSEPRSNPASPASAETGSAPAPGIKPAVGATGATPSSPAAAAPALPAGDPPPDATAAVLAALGPASKLPGPPHPPLPHRRRRTLRLLPRCRSSLVIRSRRPARCVRHR